MGRSRDEHLYGRKRVDTPPGASTLAADAARRSCTLITGSAIATLRRHVAEINSVGPSVDTIHQARRPMHHCPPSFTLHVYRHNEGHGHPSGLDRPLRSNTKTSANRFRRSPSKVKFRESPLYTGDAGCLRIG